MTETAAACAARALTAYDFGDGATLEPLAGGLINDTFTVRDGHGDARAVLQRLHPIFAAEVNLDIAAVTAHIAARGLCTPRLVATTSGDLWTVVEGRTWRALTHVDGVCFDAITGDDLARAAGELVGRFHRATDDFRQPMAFTRAGVHDTAGYLTRLAEQCRTVGDALPAAAALGHDILAAAKALPPLPDLGRRLCHGDLKISNLLFDRNQDPARGKCLLDLDTLGYQTLATELGDALRSWCNPFSEDDPGARVNVAGFGAALAGYAAGAGDLLSGAEVAAIVPGLETLCVELAARFCIDVFEDHYFGWDASRFSSRRDHNLARARGQLALASSVASHRDELNAITRASFR